MPLQTNGRELRRRRELQGLTLTEFARRAGYTLTHVSQVELGHSNAGPRYLRTAAGILCCEIADITVSPYAEHPVTNERASA
ncbi:helix-turn-helix domain-containing protein [Streptomyces sp.]|uniref:helix-turn-helix domain-containing protein n=1 Tax=Streptomyces sp. TaxID=1931 RepID=UPI002F3F00B4